MGIGAPGTTHEPQRPAKRKRISIVVAVAFPLLLLLDVPALHVLGAGWPQAAAGGVVGAFVTAMFADIFFGVGGERALKIYGRIRAIGLAVVIAVCTGVMLLIGCSLLPAVAIGTTVALFGLMLLLKATGDL